MKTGRGSATASIIAERPLVASIGVHLFKKNKKINKNKNNKNKKNRKNNKKII